MMRFGVGDMGIVYLVVFCIVVVALAIWLVCKLFPRATNDSSPRSEAQRSDRSESPFEILQQRYASGEISGEEYEEMRRDLEG